MTPQFAVDIIRHTLLTTFWLCAPLLGLAFVAGVVISLVQITTSMQDAAFSAVPRLVAFLVGLMLFLPWMVMRIITYTTALFGDLGRYAH
jgi:flagellar biosynthetic protein FliQ